MARNRYTPNTRGAVALMNSGPIQRKVHEAAQRGLAKFRQVASAHSLTGQFAASAHLVRTRGWDGRKGVRIDARSTPGNAPIPIETGTEDTPAVGALRAARRAAGRVGPPLRRRTL